MPQEKWDDFQHRFFQISATLALITNSILINLIWFHSPKSLGTYKYLMICICLFEVVYETLDLLASTDMYTKDSAFLVIVSGKKSPFPAPMLLFINITYCGFFGTSLAIFATHFVYRYLVVIGHKKWILKSIRNIVFWLVAPLAFGAAWVITVWIFITPTPFLDNILRDQIMSHYGVGLEDVAYVGAIFYYPDDHGNTTVNWRSVHGTTIFVVMVSSSLFTMAYFGIKSYLTINSAVSKSGRSTNYRNLQSQLLLALVFQTIIPLVFMHFPSAICFLIPLLASSKEVFGQFLTISIAIYPVLDPLPNMFLIKDYRNALRRS